MQPSSFSVYRLLSPVSLLRRAWYVVRTFDCSGLTVLLVAALVLTATTASAPPNRVRATGAVGVVVRHSDGRVLYAYIPLTGDHITGAEVLQQAGFPLNVQASSSLGAAVCKLDGEGCDAPREDCFCKSYGNPAFYWHYYTRGASGTWRTSTTGAGNRVLRDGDVDGWSWTANDSALPTVTLDEIAALVRPATAAIPPANTPLPVFASLPADPLSATDAPPRIIAPPTADSPSAPTRTATDPAMTVPAPIAAPARPTPDDSTPRAVIVAPGGTITPVQPTPTSNPEGGKGLGAFGAFAGVAGGVLLLLAVGPLGARRRRSGQVRQAGQGGQNNESGESSNDETRP